MKAQRYLALAVLAYMQNNRDACMDYMAKAAEFGDDLTQFVDQVVRTGNSAVRNSPATPQSENTMAPSLRAYASSDFVQQAAVLSRQLAIASYLDDDEVLEEQQADEAFDDLLMQLETDVEGFDEDEEDEDFESVASCGPVRYKQ